MCFGWICFVRVVDKSQKGLVVPSCWARPADEQQSVDVIVDGSVGQLVPQERVHERVVVQTVTIPVLLVTEEIVEVIQTSPVPRRGVFQVVLVERIKDPVADQMMDIPFFPVMEEMMVVCRRW